MRKTLLLISFCFISLLANAQEEMLIESEDAFQSSIAFKIMIASPGVEVEQYLNPKVAISLGNFLGLIPTNKTVTGAQFHPLYTFELTGKYNIHPNLSSMRGAPVRTSFSGGYLGLLFKAYPSIDTYGLTPVYGYQDYVSDRGFWGFNVGYGYFNRTDNLYGLGVVDGRGTSNNVADYPPRTSPWSVMGVIRFGFMLN